MSDKFLTTSHFNKLSGPVYFSQCSGKVNDSNITVYLIGDEHESTEGTCYKHEDNTIDLSSFLRINFIKATEKVDFFLEIPYISHHDTNADILQKRLSYATAPFPLPDIIDEFMRDGCFLQDKSICKLKFPNVRFHYADIRYRPETYRGRELRRDLPVPYKSSICVYAYLYRTLEDNLEAIASLLIQLDEVKKGKKRFSDLLMFHHYYYKFIIFTLEQHIHCHETLKRLITKKITLSQLFDEETFVYNKLVEKQLKGVVTPAIREKIKKFIRDKVKEYESQFKKTGQWKKGDYEYLFKEVDELFAISLEYIKKLNVGEKSAICAKTNTQIAKLLNSIQSKRETIVTNFEYVANNILVVESLVMDTYLLSRLFKKSMWSKNKHAVIFTGVLHSEHYYEFLTKYMGLSLSFVAQPVEKRCLNISRLYQPLFNKHGNNGDKDKGMVSQKPSKIEIRSSKHLTKRSPKRSGKRTSKKKSTRKSK